MWLLRRTIPQWVWNSDSVLCGAYTTSVVLGFVDFGWDTGKSEFIQRRMTKVPDPIPHENWMKAFGMFVLSWN